MTGEHVFAATVRALSSLGSPNTPEGIAATVAYLTSEYCAQISGQAVNVDVGIEVH
jgi:enoyl-[acyl-carrier-protein] reductase (NADH)